MSADKKTGADIKIVVIVIIILALVAGLHFRLQNRDLDFSRRVFKGLVKGKVGVQKMIDWDNFKTLGEDIGQTYAGLPEDEKQRSAYRRVFIEKLALGFRYSGGKLDSFKNWRIYDNKAKFAVVACDYVGKDKTLLLTISKTGKRKLTSLQWEEDLNVQK